MASSRLTTLRILLGLGLIRAGEHVLRAVVATGSPRSVVFLALDIVGFARLGDREQLDRRKWLYTAVDRIQDSLAGRAAYDVLDRGDGMLVLLPGDTNLIRLFEESIPDLADWISDQRGTRMRCALHKGNVQRDHRGWVGKQINIVFRLIDSPLLRKQRKGSDAALLVAMTDAVYREASQCLRDLDEQRYRNLFRKGWASEAQKVQVQFKESDFAAWVAPVASGRHLPDPGLT